jgi:hypothetical protein
LELHERIFSTSDRHSGASGLEGIHPGRVSSLCKCRRREEGKFRVFGEPSVILEGNLTVRITEKGKTWFVWKKQRLEATAERLSELERFVVELKLLLEPH